MNFKILSMRTEEFLVWKLATEKEQPFWLKESVCVVCIQKCQKDVNDAIKPFLESVKYLWMKQLHGSCLLYKIIINLSVNLSVPLDLLW